MYKKILVPLDGSKLAECVLPHVETIARGGNTENVTFIRVFEPLSLPVSVGEGYTLSTDDWPKIEEASKAAAENYLNKLTSKLKYDKVKIQTEVMVGKPAETIADYATSNGVDLIAIATHGRSGVSRWVWGSVADKVLRSSRVPILVVRAPGSHPGI